MAAVGREERTMHGKSPLVNASALSSSASWGAPSLLFCPTFNSRLQFRAMSDQSPLDLGFTTPSFIYTLDGRVEVKVTRHDLTNSQLPSLSSSCFPFSPLLTWRLGQGTSFYLSLDQLPQYH